MTSDGLGSENRKLSVRYDPVNKKRKENKFSKKERNKKRKKREYRYSSAANNAPPNGPNLELRIRSKEEKEIRKCSLFWLLFFLSHTSRCSGNTNSLQQ
jgi:hypothetical protein